MRVYINKTICKFLFLHDLGGWHYSARESFRDYWSKTPSALSIDEIKALTTWNKVNERFYKKTGDFMLTAYLSESLEDIDKRTIDNIFKIFNERFEFHYKRQLHNMKQIVLYLQRFKEFQYLEKTFALYDIKRRSLPLYIAMSHNANRSAGGMQLGNIAILQFGDYKLSKDNSPMLNVLFHELTHKGSVGKLLKNNISFLPPLSFRGDSLSFLDEVIHKALWSQIGLFSQLQFKWTDREINKSYKFLVGKLESPYKEMIKKAFLVRGYLQRKIHEDSKFQFSPDSIKEIVTLISRG